MAEIRVNSQILRDAAATIQKDGATYSEIMMELQQNLQALSATWEGDAFNSFKAQLDSLIPSLDRYSEVIVEYSNFLEATAEQYEAAETASQSETDQLANNLFQ